MNRTEHRAYMARGLPCGPSAVSNARFLRGFVAWPVRVPNPHGFAVAYAVRSNACGDCAAWRKGLALVADIAIRLGSRRGDGTPATPQDIIGNHTSPRAETETATEPGGLCSACVAERAWYAKHGFGAPPHVLDVVRGYFATFAMKSGRVEDVRVAVYEAERAVVLACDAAAAPCDVAA